MTSTLQIRHRPPIFVLLAAFLLGTGVTAGTVQAQDTPAAPLTPEERIGALEAEVETLQSRVLALEDRLVALLGEDDAEQVYRIPVGDSPVRGAPDAPITLVVFGDYQSESSSRAQSAVNRLLETYPNAVRLVYKHYPLRTLHQQAHEAALAALAAQRQDKFWEMHELLFRNGRVLDGSLYPLLAEQIGLELVRFEQDRNSLWALERLTDDEKEAVRLSVRGVPTLFLNGRRLRTWRLDYLQAQVKQVLALESKPPQR